MKLDSNSTLNLIHLILRLRARRSCVMSKTLDIRRLKSNQPKTVAANKDRLQAFSSALDKEFEADLLGPLSSASAPPKQEIWRNAIVCCGSNAFNQLNIDEADIMSVNLKACPLIGADNESGASGGRLGGGGLGTGSGYGQSRKSKGKIEACESAKKKEHNGSSITCVSSGGNLSAVVQDGECYIWGEGLGPHSLRVPTAIPHITNVVQVSCGKKHCGVVTAAGEAYVNIAYDVVYLEGYASVLMLSCSIAAGASYPSYSQWHLCLSKISTSTLFTDTRGDPTRAACLATDTRAKSRLAVLSS